MSASVETFSMIVLLVIGLQSSEGKHGKNENAVQEVDFLQSLITDKGELKLKVEKKQELKLEPQANISRNEGTKHEQNLQPYLGETDGMNNDQLQTGVIEKQNLDGYVHPNQRLEHEVQSQIDEKIEKETKYKEHSQISGQNSSKTKLENRIWLTMRGRQRPYFENFVSPLWKRGQGHSTRTYQSEQSRAKPKESQRNAPPISRRSDLSDSDVPSPPITRHPSPTKRKSKLVKLITSSFSKTQRIFSGDKGRKNSETEGLGTQLTSGYTKKPTRLRQVDEDAQLSDSPRRSSTYRANQSPDVGTAYESPAKTPEINQMWDFINRHSKNWSESADAFPTQGNSSPSKRKSPPTSPPESPRKSPNVGQQIADRKVDKDARHFIKRHRKGWESSDGVPAKDISTSPSDKDSPSEKRQVPKRSPPASPTRPAYRSPTTTSGKKLRHLSNKELDKEYDAYITRSRERYGTD